MRSIIKLTRPYQWVKNAFVFMPLFFGGSLTDPGLLWQATAAFFSFCFIASSIYCYNDIIDVEADRRHEEKRHRPIASGKISVMQGYGVMLTCIALSIASLTMLRSAFLPTLATIVFYFVMEILYCNILKRIAVIDVFTLAMGFVLRIITGGMATQIMPSHWLIMMTFLLTLLMAFGKRRDDVIKYNKTGIAPRHNTKHYNLTFINQAITVNASVTLVCYIMYALTVTPAKNSLNILPDMGMAGGQDHSAIFTTIFVCLGLLRYMQLTSVEEKSGDPTKLVLTDRFLQLTVLLWFLTFLVIIYL